MERRLAAIVHADIAGFTRMMEGSETRTFRHLKAAQIEVWRPAIDAAKGRIVGTAGDAMLAEFGSAVTAVSAALDIQERMARFNETLDPEQRMNFRIGVHLGEVIVDDEDQNIFGDGVNLAARIQALAEPGGIAVSRAVRDLVELRIEYAFVDGGEHKPKNVSRSVQIFHVRPAAKEPVAPPAPAAPPPGATVMANTTTRMVPQITLRFEGVDSTNNKHGFEVTLEKLMSRPEGMVIGRAADQCDFVLAHPTVSRKHAKLMLSGEALQVEDLGSTNGTKAGEQLLRPGQPAALHAGDKLRVGDIELQMKHL
ncbi:MAG: adenylate/guanylate cyclase domain-containing protein [Proteobacteria bacterium]|nr:adenylate/guanylate cyclase domain-containing protein [Pseudomonadota bacterium]